MRRSAVRDAASRIVPYGAGHRSLLTEFLRLLMRQEPVES